MTCNANHFLVCFYLSIGGGQLGSSAGVPHTSRGWRAVGWVTEVTEPSLAQACSHGVVEGHE